jgi:hypothetical protein
MEASNATPQRRRTVVAAAPAVLSRTQAPGASAICQSRIDLTETCGLPPSALRDKAGLTQTSYSVFVPPGSAGKKVVPL